MEEASPADGVQAVVIWNSGAGSSRQAAELLDTIRCRPDLAVFETESREESLRRVADACRRGMARVIAAGGDGTVNAVVTALADWGREHRRGPALAVLPLGTGNDLARSLGMPLIPLEAFDLCLSAGIRPMDVMELKVDGETPQFAGNMITAGNTGKYLTVLTDELKQRWGALCYLRGVVNVLEDLQVFRMSLEFDGTAPIEVDALNLFVANGRTSGGGITVCRDARLNDGHLDVLLIRDGTGLDLASLTLDYLTSDLRENELVFYRRCRKLRVSCQTSIPLSTDGDAATAVRFSVSAMPSVIQAVMVQTPQ
ncbi:MAG TPA: YegS/Rv2252/BmrU family lipid kinase [Caulifigura sp.]|nr:YegS/Rv2252/BmrU family lipid kinase [Caulifigura sp.]